MPDNTHNHPGNDHQSGRKHLGTIDPVCGMEVAKTSDARSARYGNQEFFFCSDGCQAKFEGDPWFYASGSAGKPGQKTQPGTQWTCPMHPEIVSDEPGACPICGMALEPMLPSDEPSEELSDFTRRMWISDAAAVPLVILTMGELFGLPVRDWIGHRVAAYVEFLLATPIIVWAARPFFQRGWESIGEVA